MAKRRKKTRSKMSGVRRKRSRVSGLGSIDIMNIGSILVGGLIAGYINKFNTEDATTKERKINPTIFAGGKLALGVALPMFIKNPIASGVGAGMIAVGGLELIKNLAPTMVSGFGALEDSDTISISLEGVNVLSGNDFNEGVLAGNDISVVNGNDDIAVINGMDNDMFDNDDDYL
jgi:hypothetical protein